MSGLLSGLRSFAGFVAYLFTAVIILGVAWALIIGAGSLIVWVVTP